MKETCTAREVKRRKGGERELKEKKGCHMPYSMPGAGGGAWVTGVDLDPGAGGGAWVTGLPATSQRGGGQRSRPRQHARPYKALAARALYKAGPPSQQHVAWLGLLDSTFTFRNLDSELADHLPST